LLLAIAGLVLFAKHAEQANVEEQQERTRQAIAKADADRAKRRADFNANKTQILVNADALLQANDFEKARTLLAGYAAA